MNDQLMIEYILECNVHPFYCSLCITKIACITFCWFVSTLSIVISQELGRTLIQMIKHLSIGLNILIKNKLLLYCSLFLWILILPFKNMHCFAAWCKVLYLMSPQWAWTVKFENYNRIWFRDNNIIFISGETKNLLFSSFVICSCDLNGKNIS